MIFAAESAKIMLLHIERDAAKSDEKMRFYAFPAQPRTSTSL